NVETPAQVRRLTASVRDAVGREAPVLVDQEGGRVQRLGPPHWPPYPPGADYGRLYDRNAAEGIRAAYLGARLIAADLAGAGADVDVLPMPDAAVAGALAVLADPAYRETAELGAFPERPVARGRPAGGVLPGPK